ncbi:MAG: hypothetical protein M3Z24_04465, partial [Chloroflexota bacterium]|nr:hypothetical protein [Chloroflexota bacterium]
ALPQSETKSAGSSSLSGLIGPIGIASAPNRLKNHSIPTRPNNTPTTLSPQSIQGHPTPAHLLALRTPGQTDIPEQQRPVEYSPSLTATSRAAEHWRTSWRNRQHAEAGPATEVSRGQSAVPEPLMAMQHSLMRMRAIILPDKADEHNSRVRFWCSLLLILGLMSLSGAYIFSTFLPQASIAHPAAPGETTLSPHLTVASPQSATIAQGQALHIYGEHFRGGDPIRFVLDSSRILNGTNGKEITVVASDQGNFDVVVPITPLWTPGLHILQADDKKTGQSAYLNVQISSGRGSLSTILPSNIGRYFL